MNKKKGTRGEAEEESQTWERRETTRRKGGQFFVADINKKKSMNNY